MLLFSLLDFLSFNLAVSATISAAQLRVRRTEQVSKQSSLKFE